MSNEHEDIGHGALASLAKDQAPGRDLWPAIAARLDAPSEAALPPATAEALTALAVGRAPDRDLWPSIATRIERRQRQRRHAPWLAAASLAASLVVVLGWQVQRESSSRHAPLHAPAELPAMDDVRNPALMQTANHPMRSETRALVRANLRIVNGAEAQLQRALAAEPNAAYLRSLLATTRQQQRELRGALNSTEVASASDR